MSRKATAIAMARVVSPASCHATLSTMCTLRDAIVRFNSTIVAQEEVESSKIGLQAWMTFRTPWCMESYTNIWEAHMQTRAPLWKPRRSYSSLLYDLRNDSDRYEPCSTAAARSYCTVGWSASAQNTNETFDYRCATLTPDPASWPRHATSRDSCGEP